MTVVNTHEAKTHLSRLLDRAQAGEEIIIARAGRPLARLMPIGLPDARVPGSARALVAIGEGFDAPLDEFAELM